MGLSMEIDKELYRNTYENYRQWNEAELVERIRNSGSLSPIKAWEQYVDLWEFCLELSPEPSDLQSKLKFLDWQKYYSRIQRLEEWKRQHGKKT
jgi:hypothetical protein